MPRGGSLGSSREFEEPKLPWAEEGWRAQEPLFKLQVALKCLAGGVRGRLRENGGELHGGADTGRLLPAAGVDEDSP